MEPIGISLIRRRILWLVVCTGCLFAILGGRLFVLMVFPVFPDAKVHGILQWTALRSRADMEHFHLHLVNNARGKILFRSGAPIPTGGSDGKDNNSLVGVIGQPDEWPFFHRDVAVYGRTGLQHAFDPILQGTHGGFVGMLRRNSMTNKPFYISAKTGADIRTTLDSVWQTASERALNRARVQNGAVVLLDVHTNQVLAMASRSQQPFENEAVRTFAPGSIFKIVVVAAALETHVIQRTAHFVCNGRIDTPEVHMACWTTHGFESLTEALVQSCDVAFAKIGIALGRNPIAMMAHQLELDSTGLQQIDGKNVLPEALPSQIYAQQTRDAGLLANTAIGQEDVRITPLQGALLASAVAHGGLTREATLVLDAEKQGQSILTFTGLGGWHKAFSESTAAFLATAMQKVVSDEQGTAHDLYSFPVAAKTGTAELATQSSVNAWLIGYLPANRPQIAFAVVSAEVSSRKGHLQTRQIVRDLANLYMQIYPPSLIR